jgi:hypothetical protein
MSMQLKKKRPSRGTASEVAGNMLDKMEKKKQMERSTAISKKFYEIGK